MGLALPTTPSGSLKPPSSGPITALTYSSSLGQYLLLGTASRQIHLHNPSRGGPAIQTYSAHGYQVSSLAIAPDNATFASAGGDRAVFLWDVARAVTIRRFVGHEARVDSVAFGGVTVGKDGTGDNTGGGGVVGTLGQVLVSGSFDKTVRLWDVRGGGKQGCVMTLGEARDGVLTVGCDPDEARVWSGGADGRLREYDIRQGMLREDAIGSPVTCVTMARNHAADDSAACFLVGSLDGKIRLMDRRDGSCLTTFAGHRNSEYKIRNRAAGSEGQYVISGSEDGKIAVWGRTTGGLPIASLSGPTPEKLINCIAYNLKTNGWASGGSGGSVTLWGAQR